jgi:hypothetical protein
MLLNKRMVPLTNGNKSRVLASAWARRDWELAQTFMEKCVDPTTCVGIVYKAVKLLDAKREAAALERRLLRDEKQLEKLNGKIRASKLRKARRNADLVRSNVNDLRAEPTPECATLTSSVATQIKKLLTSLPPDAYNSHGREHVWRHICDLVHIQPGRIPAEGFMEGLFNKQAGAQQTGILTEENLLEAVQQGVSYDKIRAVLPDVARAGVNEDVMMALAKHEDLDTLLWWYDTELNSPHVEKAIHARLSDGQIPTLSYGKLVERIVTFGTVPDTGPKSLDEALEGMGLSAADLPYEVLQEIRQQIAAEMAANPQPEHHIPSFLPMLVQAAGVRQNDIALPLRTPVLVAGDMSASIIASIITGLAEAELVLFNDFQVMPPSQPKDCESAVEVSRQVRAIGPTANAAALVEAYEQRKVYNTVVMVTDEEENTPAVLSTGEAVMFAELFGRYREQVAPECKLVMVSFLQNMSAETQLMSSLRDAGIPDAIVSQFKFNQGRPDLTKLDAMLGLLSCDTDDFVHELGAITAQIREAGIAGWVTAEAMASEERAHAAKQAKMEALLCQLSELAPAQQLHEMIDGGAQL